MDPTFAISFQEIKSKFQGNNKISKNSSLIIKKNIDKIENLDLADCSLIIDKEKIVKEEIVFIALNENDEATKEEKIRGFKI